MKAGPVVVGQLLQNRHRFCVPIYQRHYVWKREDHWEPFWNDIRTKAIERMAGRDRRFSHFMGALVLESRGGFSVKRVPAFQVVDGQQRLTTFQIFLAAARDYAVEVGLASTAERIAGYLLNRDPHLMEDADIEIFKVWPTKYDRELFTDIVRFGKRSEIRVKYNRYFYKTKDKIYDYSTTPRLLAAYGYFYDRIRFSVTTDDLEDEFTDLFEDSEANENGGDSTSEDPNNARQIRLDAIWQSLVEEFKIVEITLEEGDDAQVIFETLNARGEPLLAADLVRNFIFQRAGSTNSEQLFDENWQLFEQPFWSSLERQGRYRKPRIEFFLANYIAGKIAGEVDLSKLFSEYKSFVRRQAYPSVADELVDIKNHGVIYKELVSRDTEGDLSNFARRLLPWDVTTVFPIVLRLWANATIDALDKKYFLDVLLSFIVRRAICGLTSKNYNKYFLGLITHLDENGWTKTFLKTIVLAQNSDTSRFPSDEELEQRWAANPTYSTLGSARVRAILEELEKSKRTSFHETNALASDLTVEHVLPQQWQANWPLQDGTIPTDEQLYQAAFAFEEDESLTGRIVRRNRLKETIGNLTLLTQPLNSSVSNGAYPEKRAALQENSLLVLNKEITASDLWTEDQISARSKYLLDTAKLIWAMP